MYRLFAPDTCPSHAVLTSSNPTTNASWQDISSALCVRAIVLAWILKLGQTVFIAVCHVESYHVCDFRTLHCLAATLRWSYGAFLDEEFIRPNDTIAAVQVGAGNLRYVRQLEFIKTRHTLLQFLDKLLHRAKRRSESLTSFLAVLRFGNIGVFTCLWIRFFQS
jgi:hypothetical protein